MKAMCFVLLFLLNNSCTSTKHRATYSDHIKNGRCEYASETIPLLREDLDFLTKIKQTSGYTVSYITIVLGISVDAMLLLASNGAWREPLIGAYAAKGTQALRCSNVTYLSKHLREIAQCFVARKDKHNLELAQNLLHHMKSQEAFFKCLDNNEKIDLTLQFNTTNNQAIKLNLPSLASAHPRPTSIGGTVFDQEPPPTKKSNKTLFDYKEPIKMKYDVKIIENQHAAKFNPQKCTHLGRVEKTSNSSVLFYYGLAEKDVKRKLVEHAFNISADTLILENIYSSFPKTYATGNYFYCGDKK